MALTEIAVHHFRNFDHFVLRDLGSINLITGQNGSGKTSLLEAIYYLSFGRSFRVSRAEKMVKKGEEQFTVHAKWQDPSTALLSSIGVHYQQFDNRKKISINQQDTKTLAELSRMLPLQYIGANIAGPFFADPQTRRRYLNWGVFHVEHQFHRIWNQYLHLVQQRNHALKNKQGAGELQQWELLLLDQALLTHQFRKDYVEQLTPIFQMIIKKLLPNDAITLHYEPGWDDRYSLAAVLEQNRAHDWLVGHTSAGPHRADLKLIMGSAAAVEAGRDPALVFAEPVVSANEFLSQGQQKLAVYALLIAQGVLLSQYRTAETILFLLDDFASELDVQNQGRVLEVLNGYPFQLFITCIENNTAPVFDSVYGKMATFYLEKDSNSWVKQAEALY